MIMKIYLLTIEHVRGEGAELCQEENENRCDPNSKRQAVGTGCVAVFHPRACLFLTLC